MKTYLTRPKAADHLTKRGLPTTKGTLQKFATTGGGPKYRKYGNKAVYTPEDLDQWADERMGEAHHSTSEAGTAKLSANRRADRPKARESSAEPAE